MDQSGRTRALVEAETGALVGALAAALATAPDHGLPAGLDLLVTGLGLRSAVLRSVPVGDLLAVAGEVVHAVPPRRGVRTAAAPSVELPVRGAGGRELARLTVVGGRPSHLPALRAGAAVLGLALTVRGGDEPAVATTQASELVRGGEDGLDDVADLLHDGPVQALVAARYACDVAVRGGSAADARDAVQEALVALRRTLWHLRPRGEDGLAAALEALSHRLAEAGLPGLLLALDRPAADLLGPAARTTAYRLVQTVALGDREAPVRVALRRSGDAVALHVDGGSPLPDPDRWVRRCRALGGDLSSSAGRLRLVLPTVLPARDLDTDPKALT